MISLALRWVFSALTIFALAKTLPGFRIKSFGTAMIVAGVYGILHLVFFRILVVISFIPYIITFGLFGLVINALLLFVADKLIEDYEIESIGKTFIAAVILTISNMVFGAIF